MKKAVLLLSLVVSVNSFAEDFFCKGKKCSDFDNYISQIKETYLKMQNLNDSCQKNDGKSCDELATLVRDSDLTIKPEYKDSNKKLLEKLGINSDPKIYFQKACDLKLQSACAEAKK